MIGSPKEWAAMLGYDRGSDERTMAARARVLTRALDYLDAHLADPGGPRPSEELVAEFGQFLLLAEDAESKGRGAKFRELHEAIVALHLHWDETGREAAFQAIAKTRALFKGVVAFSDAWLGTETPPPIRLPSPEPECFPDEAEVKTRLVSPSQARS